MDALRTLEILITSRTPLIAIETLEEERVEQALERVAQRLRIPLFVWTMTPGLRRAGALDALYDTKEPLKALRNLADLPNEGIYLMKDLYRSLGDAAVVRTLQDMARTFSRDRRAMVLTAPRVELPSELAVLASLVRLELPTEDDLRALAQEVFGNFARRHRDPAGFDLPALTAAAEGFSGAEIEQTVVAALYTAFARGAQLSTEHILQEIKATKPLSVTRAEGVQDLREWARGRAVPAS